MRDNSPKLALLLKEAGVLTDAMWEKYATQKKREGRGHKSLYDIVAKQSAYSPETYRDLYIFGRMALQSVTGDDLPEARDLREMLRITEAELIQALQANEPDVKALGQMLRDIGVHLSPPQITTLSETEGMGKRGYALLVRRGIITPERFSAMVEAGHASVTQPNRVQLASNVLSNNGVCTLEEFLAAYDQAREQDKPVGFILEQQGKLSTNNFIAQLEEGLDLPEVDLSQDKISKKVLGLFPASFVRRHVFLPVQRTKTVLTVAVADPLYMALSDALSILTGLVVVPLYAPQDDLLDQINSLYPDIAEAQVEEGLDYAVPEAPSPARETARAGRDERLDRQSAVQLVTQMIQNAIVARATDIHIEPLPDTLRVRYRVDGALRHVMSLPIEMQQAITARIKVLANMNVTERRRPQDGSFGSVIDNANFDFRISVLPTHLGEKIVIRVLDQRTVLKAMSELGMTDFQEQTLRSWILKPYGIILVTGPTGSGKSSTLYSCLNALNKIERNIITIEDPVEYQLEGITQVHVEPHIDVTFANGLRSALRQDPDVIMVGEIRDLETAQISMRAALTGHLVLSTLHTNNAVGAVSALRHMGVRPYVVSSALIGIVAQRLIKILCNECKRKRKASPGVLADFGIKVEDDKTYWFWYSEGCDACLDTGYSGRTGIFEMFVVDEAVRDLISDEAPETELIAASKQAGLTTLMDSAVAKLAAGTTSPEEVMRTVMLMS